MTKSENCLIATLMVLVTYQKKVLYIKLKWQHRVVHGNPAVLKVLELVPNECCQKFKKPRRSESQIYVEFVHLSSRQFNSWIAASEVKTMDDFWELGILQQLK